MAPSIMIPCRFFAQGTCRNGASCNFVHGEIVRPSQAPPESRAEVPCRFFSRPGGCQNASCPFLHAADGRGMGLVEPRDFEVDEDKDEERNDDFIRTFSGASVQFNEFGHVIKVSLPADFSLVCITGLPPGITATATVEILRALDFNIDVNCIRIPEHTALAETKAMVKVEDPLFAKKLSTKLKDTKSTFTATPVRIDPREASCRKVYISWHKATRSAWLNFGNGDIADRVAKKFNEGRYKFLGQSVRSSTATRSSSRGTKINPVAWTITLSNVRSDVKPQDVEKAIGAPFDKPRHVELGKSSYNASEAEVSVDVRSNLEEHGPLESFHLATNSKGRRARAIAWFQDDSDARSACSLNNRPLQLLGGGKLTVTLVQSAKLKVATAVYLALKSKIDELNTILKEQYIWLRTYQADQYTTFKLEGSNAKDLAGTRRKLEEILRGVIMKDGDSVVWDTALNTNRKMYLKLKSIAEELHVVIIRDKSMRQLRFCGPSEKFEQAVGRITKMLKEESCSSFEIDLKPLQFSWAIRGGFKTIEQVLDKKVAGFNVVSKKITIHGTQEQYNTALAIMKGKHDALVLPASDNSSEAEGDCPICWCEADNPIKTSCKHTYCLECFEECCRSAVSTSQAEFQIKCQGDGGTCSTAFTLQEVKDYVSSFVFENVLKSTFGEYVQRNPQTFRYCPTPDCGYIYRCSATSSPKPPAYTCSNCFEPLCTSCHSRHGNLTCAEYKDIEAGGPQALAALKRKLNVRDCPKCTTMIEKTEGCNHMTCPGCKTHICWVCMAVFGTSKPCYDHMIQKHGSIGLGLEQFMH